MSERHIFTIQFILWDSTNRQLNGFTDGAPFKKVRGEMIPVEWFCFCLALVRAGILIDRSGFSITRAGTLVARAGILMAQAVILTSQTGILMAPV